MSQLHDVDMAAFTRTTLARTEETTERYLWTWRCRKCCKRFMAIQCENVLNPLPTVPEERIPSDVSALLKTPREVCPESEVAT